MQKPACRPHPLTSFVLLKSLRKGKAFLSVTLSPDSRTVHFNFICITWVMSGKTGVGREVMNQELIPSIISEFK